MKRPHWGWALALACVIAAPIAFAQTTGTFTIQRFADYINSLGAASSLTASDGVPIRQNGVMKKWLPFNYFLDHTASNVADAAAARTNLGAMSRDAANVSDAATARGNLSAMARDGSDATMPDAAQNLHLGLNVKFFGAIGDGNSHPLSERYATLALAQAVCPSATSLTQEIDWCAAQAAINYAEALPAVPLVNAKRGAEIYWPAGYYRHGTSTLKANNVSLHLRGDGAKSSSIEYTGSAGVNLLDFGKDGHMSIIGSTSIGAAGSGYTAGNVLTCAGGAVITIPCQVTVSTVDGSGAVTGYTLTAAGDYGTPPNSPIAVTGGSGTGFTLTAESWTRNSGPLRVSGMSWFNAGAGGIAINAQFNISTPTLTVDHMEFRVSGAGFFAQVINCLGCSYAIIEHNQAYGELPGSTHFAYLEDRNNLLGHYSNKFLGNYINRFVKAFHLVSNSTVAQQGPRFQWNDHVKGQNFLYLESLLGTAPPEYTLLDNEAQIDGYFVDGTGSVQDLKAIGNEIYIGDGGMSPAPATGGGFNLRGGLGAIVSQNILNVTGTNVPTVNFLTSDGTHGQAVNNIYRNAIGGAVTTNGITLEPGAIFWYERGNDPVSGITTSVTDNGSSNDTSLAPKLNAPVITNGATINSGMLRMAMTNGATALGTDQASCFEITRTMVRFTTVAAGTGACLSSLNNAETLVVNAGANALLVYPPTSGTINGAAANVPVSVPAGASWRFSRYAASIIGSDLNLGGVFSAGIKTPKNFITAVDAGSADLTCNQAAIFDHTAGIPAFTVNMPAAPTEGCWVSLGTAFNITTLTMADPNAHPITGALTTITATTPAAWVYHSSRWYRCVACE